MTTNVNLDLMEEALERCGEMGSNYVSWSFANRDAVVREFAARRPEVPPPPNFIEEPK